MFVTYQSVFRLQTLNSQPQNLDCQTEVNKFLQHILVSINFTDVQMFCIT